MQIPGPQDAQQTDARKALDIQGHEYRCVFNSCSVGMVSRVKIPLETFLIRHVFLQAIASMGGAFIDCNLLFCNISQYTKQEVCSMTIFNLTSRVDLQNAFDLISQMITPGADGLPSESNPPPCLLRGAMKSRNDLGLSVALVKGADGVAKCFCVTLVNSTPYAKHAPAMHAPAMVQSVQSVQSMQSVQSVVLEDKLSGALTSAAYTAG